MNATYQLLVALGGNAISDAHGRGDIPEQFARTRDTSRLLVDLLQQGHQLLITHGNGPQVGNILRAVETAPKEVYPIDLGLCVAESQAVIGYMICQCLRNEMLRRGLPGNPCALVTTVVVDPDDPAFRRPTKPIGRYYHQAEAEVRISADGWEMVEVPGRGFRRVMPSPVPQSIQQLDLISKLFADRELIVASGGGGIPVVHHEGWGYEGVEAVVDKDLSAALLAAGVNADGLVFVTAEDRAYLNYGKPNQQPLEAISTTEAERYLAQGHFPPGSMEPKIQAAINFLHQSPNADAFALITSTNSLKAALAGDGGTRVVRA